MFCGADRSLNRSNNTKDVGAYLALSSSPEPSAWKRFIRVSESEVGFVKRWKSFYLLGNN